MLEDGRERRWDTMFLSIFRHLHISKHLKVSWGPVLMWSRYIMMKCVFLFVTKNDHFLKRPVCLFVCLYRFILTSLKVESGK